MPFLHRTIDFLGHVISPEGVRPKPSKVDLINSFPPPTTAKQIKQFLGLAGYYRRFIPNFAHRAAPLTKLLRKNVKFSWSPECQTAFTELQHCLTTPPVLAFPDFTLPYHLYTDASGDAMGMILGQTQNNEERVIAYAGRTLTKPERNYTVTEQEALAVITGVKHFSSYLHGRKFTIHTDHSSLKWLFTTKYLKGRAARWALMLQGYDFDIKHRPGTANQHADALSHLQPAVITCDATGYTPDVLYNCQCRAPSLLQLILFLESQEPYTSSVPPELSAMNPPKFVLTKDGILYKHHKPPKSYDPDSVLVIPDNLREEILINAHDSPLAGHFGFQKTYAKIKTNYWWPLMYS